MGRHATPRPLKGMLQERNIMYVQQLDSKCKAGREYVRDYVIASP